MSYIVRIDPDGSITEYHRKDLSALAREAFDGDIDIVSCRAVVSSPVLVGAVDDWGVQKKLPVNLKAWALYGRSPIVGPMFAALDGGDDRPPFPEVLLQVLTEGNFPSLPILAAMREMKDRIAASAEHDYVWPEGW